MADWLTINKTGDCGSYDVIVTAEDNATLSARVATIIATSTSYSLSAKCEVTQYAAEPTTEWVSFSAASAQTVTKPSGATMEYSYDTANWSSMTAAVDFGTTGKETVYVRGKNTSGFNWNNFTFGNTTSMVALGGNAMALLDYENTGLTMSAQSFCNLFSGATALQTVSSNFLPTMNLSQNCYNGMFKGCTSLVSAPALPATTLAEGCYYYMFNGCTALVSAPALPATVLAKYCYMCMFWGCTSLTAAPSLPATTLASDCYTSMFIDCVSLTSAPALPATTLASDCYNGMFWGCIKLTSSPELPATILVDSCYRSMFLGCSSLNEIHTSAQTISASNCTYGWVSGVSATGNFYCPSATSWTTGVSGIPSGWVRHSTDTPTLTAITFSAVSWTTDVPASGGTADKDNCNYSVISIYSDGSTGNVTTTATISGSTSVSASTLTTRHSAGTLTLGAYYSGKSATTNVTIYQAASGSGNNFFLSNDTEANLNITTGTLYYSDGTEADFNGMSYGESVSVEVPSCGVITGCNLTLAGAVSLPSSLGFGDGNTLYKQSSASYVDTYSGTGFNQSVSIGDVIDIVSYG